MDSSIPRCILLLVLIVVGGFFSGAETAFSYCNKIRMKTLADDGNAAAKRVVKITDEFDKMLVTVLIMINILHVLSSSVATVLAISLMPNNSQLATLISTVVLTILVFFVSETIPKSFAKENCDAYALHSSLFIYGLVLILTPVSFLFTKLGDLCKKIFSSKKDEPSMTGDELSDIVEQVEDEGVIAPEESRIIKSAIEFGDTDVKDILTPADQVVALEKNLAPEKIVEILMKERFSRVPVYDRDLSHVIGILQTKEYLGRRMNQEPGSDEPDWKEFLQPAYFVKPGMKLEALFESMGRRRTHFAIVANQRGTMLGVVTMEDILEELVGEIYDEDDSVPVSSGKEEAIHG